MKRLDEYWYSRNAVAVGLTPLSWLFCTLASLRRGCYRLGIFRSVELPVPVVVVGNITVGGTGKTPLVTWLVRCLREAGFRPGVVSRGYGGRSAHWPRSVNPGSDPVEVGDEPLLIARRTGCPVVVGPDRVAAARALLEEAQVDVVISDDGLQHYRLGRDVEIAVIDGQRRFGNGKCLPAGPLRECPRRLETVDLVVANGAPGPGEFGMSLALSDALPVAGRGAATALSAWRGQQVHAVAGIGYPGRFFKALRAVGIEPIEHPFPDHHPFTREEIDFGDGLPVLMTEKDAVKCAGLAHERHWFVPVEARLPAAVGERLLEKLRR